MGIRYAVALAGLLALADAFFPPEVDLTPPKEAFTPFFNLEVLYSPNTSLIGWYLTNGDQGLLSLTPNRTLRSTFYQSTTDWTNREHPEGGSVLVQNITDAVPYNVPGTVYTPRNQIAGTTGCLTCDPTGLPIEASVFTRSQEEWDEDGSWELDFGIDLFTHQVHFNVTEGGALSGWTKPQACWFANEFDPTDTFHRFIVTKELYPENCSYVDLIWTFVDF